MDKIASRDRARRSPIEPDVSQLDRLLNARFSRLGRSGPLARHHLRLLLVVPVFVVTAVTSIVEAPTVEATECTPYATGFTVCAAIRQRYESVVGLRDVL